MVWDDDERDPPLTAPHQCSLSLSQDHPALDQHEVLQARVRVTRVMGIVTRERSGANVCTANMRLVFTDEINARALHSSARVFCV